MTFPLVRFVSAPEPDATIRFDFNDDDAVAPRRVEQGFTLGAPTLEGEPDAMGVQFGWRQPTFVQRVKGQKVHAMRVLSLLSRELLRPTNWLMFQLDAVSSPVWLKVYRNQFNPLVLENVWVDTPSGDTAPLPDTWRIEVPLVADAFGYGQRVTLDPVTVVQDSTGSNQMRIELPPISGDAPTGLRVEIAPETGHAASASGGGWLVAAVSGDADFVDPIIEIGTGDGFFAGTGTAAGTSQAGHFGGTRRVVTIAAATPNLDERLAGLFPAVPIGRYKVQLRCQAGATGGVNQTLLFRFVEKTTPIYRGAATPFYLDDGDTDRKFWVDLGEIQVPTRVRPPVDAFGDPHPVSFGLEIGTADGSAASVSIDAFKLIPIDGPHVDQATLMTFGGGYVPLRGGIVGTLDGDLEEYWSYNDVSDILNGGQPLKAGAFPVVDPASPRHALIVMAADSGPYDGVIAAPYITDRGTEATVTVSYHPRWLHLGDGA